MLALGSYRSKSLKVHNMEWFSWVLIHIILYVGMTRAQCQNIHKTGYMSRLDHKGGENASNKNQ